MQTVLLKAKTDRGEGDLSLREAPLSDAEEGSRWGGACLGPTAHPWLRFLAHGCWSAVPGSMAWDAGARAGLWHLCQCAVLCCVTLVTDGHRPNSRELSIAGLGHEPAGTQVAFSCHQPLKWAAQPGRKGRLCSRVHWRVGLYWMRGLGPVLLGAQNPLGAGFSRRRHLSVVPAR